MLRIKQEGPTCGVVALTYGLAPYVDKHKDINKLYEEMFDKSIESGLAYLGIVSSVYVMRSIAWVFRRQESEFKRILRYDPQVTAFDSEKDMDYKIRKALKLGKRVIIACPRRGLNKNNVLQRITWLTICGRDKGYYEFLSGFTNTGTHLVEASSLFKGNSMLEGAFSLKKYYRSLLFENIVGRVNNHYIKGRLKDKIDKTYDVELEIDVKGVFLEI